MQAVAGPFAGSECGMVPSSNLYLIGPMGAGKSSVGRALASRRGWAFVDLDQVIEDAAGATIQQIFATEGEAGFRQREQEQLALMTARQRIVLACGGGVILSGANRRALVGHGLVVYLDIDVDEQLRRLGRDRQRPLLQTPDRRQRLQILAAERNPLYRQTADVHLRCNAQGVQPTVDELLAAVEGKWVAMNPEQAK